MFTIKRFPWAVLLTVLLLVLGAAVASAQTNVPGASTSPSGGDPVLREQVIPNPPASPAAGIRGLTTASTAPTCNTLWGGGWSNDNSVLGVNTQILRGVYYTPSDSADLGTCDEFPGALWITSRYTPTVKIEYGVSVTQTFTSAAWIDLDRNGVYDLLPLGEEWGGVPATITLTLGTTPTTYVEIWNVEIGAEPELIETRGTSPVPAPKPAARAAGSQAFTVGIGWDAVPNGFTNTVLHGAFYDGAEFYAVCNNECAVTFGGKSYTSTNSDGWTGDTFWDVSLPGTPTAGTVGPWAFTIKQAGKADEEWTFNVGAVPTKK